MKIFQIAAASLLAVWLVGNCPVRGANALEEWSWTDIRGTTHVPFADPATRAVVLVFISTDCPIANSYQPELARLANDFPAPAFRWFLVHPDPAVSDEAALAHVREYGIEIPVVVDRDQRLTRAVSAEVTPQAFVVTKPGQAPAYAGRIDDTYADYGKKRANPNHRDLAAALKAVAAGEPIAVARTEAIGCRIATADKAAADQPVAAVTATATPAEPKSAPAQEPTANKYDPLQVGGDDPQQLTLTVVDTNRNREIPLRVYLPKQHQPAPVILFSHGLGGSRDNSPYLGNHWARRGYVVVYLQHPGSDEQVWRGVRLGERMDAMRQAASGQNFQLRVQDVPAVIDQLEIWNREGGNPLHGRLDLDHLGMSGHSFGAVTTQAVSGQSFFGRARFTDPRIRAAVLMSPSPPAAGVADRAFGQVAIPWLLLTGTEDVSILSETTVEARLSVYPALPAGSKYELVLHHAEHSAFSERALPGDQQGRNPNHHRAILAATTAFWDAYLRQQAAARDWLDGPQLAQEILEPADRWQRK